MHQVKELDVSSMRRQGVFTQGQPARGPEGNENEIQLKELARTIEKITIHAYLSPIVIFITSRDVAKDCRNI